ncbi:MAG: GNAT family N-acetyltransferase [Bacteroidales bacterium]
MGYLSDNCAFALLTEQLIAQSSSFACGNEDLDSFFHSDFVAYAKVMFGKTYCFHEVNNPTQIVCAFTVSNASIFTNRLPNARKKKVSKEVPHVKQDLTYPAVLIGRLGIDVQYQRLHIGSELMDFIKSWFAEPENKTGCRYLVVDAYNCDTPITFYLKNGFDFVFSTEEQEKEYRNIDSDDSLKTRLMYFDLIRIS